MYLFEFDGIVPVVKNRKNFSQEDGDAIRCFSVCSEWQISHNILNDVSQQSDALGHCHFVGLNHLNGEFNAVESLGPV